MKPAAVDLVSSSRGRRSIATRGRPGRPDRIETMTRKTILAAASALATVLVGAPAARAHSWPGAGATAEQYEVEIPAGAIPPGPARGELSSEGSRFRVRFEMPAAGPAHVTFWRDYRSGMPPAGKFEAVITSDRGGTVRIPVD